MPEGMGLARIAIIQIAIRLHPEWTFAFTPTHCIICTFVHLFPGVDRAGQNRGGKGDPRLVLL